MKYTMKYKKYLSGAIAAFLIIGSGIAQAQQSHKGHDHSVTVNQVNNGHHKQKSYGQHYQQYKNKHHQNRRYSNKHHSNKGHVGKGYGHKNYGNQGYGGNYYSPKHAYKRYYEQGRGHYKHRKGYKQHRGHSSLKNSYWGAHKSHGYQHKRVNKHDYYYNSKGFYFPGLGLVKHGHKHNAYCDDWHFSSLVASSVLASIYHR